MTPPENLPWCERFFAWEVNMQNSVNKSERNSLLTYVSVKPVLNWANVCSPEHTSDTSTNYDSFLN